VNTRIEPGMALLAGGQALTLARLSRRMSTGTAGSGDGRIAVRACSDNAGANQKDLRSAKEGLRTARRLGKRRYHPEEDGRLDQGSRLVTARRVAAAKPDPELVACRRGDPLGRVFSSRRPFSSTKPHR